MKKLTYFSKLFLIIASTELIIIAISSATLTAIHQSYYAVNLYQQIRDKEQPLESDSAYKDPRTRESICKDITGNEFFTWKLLTSPLDEQNIQHKLKQLGMLDLFDQIYQPSNRFFMRFFYPYIYMNPFVRLEFEVKKSSQSTIHTTEDVFVCLLKRRYQDEIVPVYVSKEYNVFGVPYMAGRFIFRKREYPPSQPQHSYLLLAEEPATVDVKSNLELYYLDIREYRKPAPDETLDPLCRMVPSSMWTNQSQRLCVQVLRSAAYTDKIHYPMPWRASVGCVRQKISFKTPEALRRADGKLYEEFMIRCDSTLKNSTELISYYVSRAYGQNQVFVYGIENLENVEDKVYLENLCDNVTLVNEISRLDDVED